MAFKCPFCEHDGMPIIEKKMSGTGWVIFVLLLLFCLPLCWIPFVTSGTKEEIRKCARCGNRLG
ncbi:MAG: LITAF-like zinc ribbon domain-containing protein [Paludibacteraceae bacterium]|nr:LITAF-like zinc ribbon domain-containing protein [Paludibacteraceae bacterium]